MVARNYEYIAEAVKADPVWVGPEQLSLSQLLAHKNDYINKTVKITDILRINKIVRDNGNLYILATGESNNRVYLCFKSNKSWPLEVRDSELYCEGDRITELTAYGKIIVNTRRDEMYGDVDVFNIDTFGL